MNGSVTEIARGAFMKVKKYLAQILNTLFHYHFALLARSFNKNQSQFIKNPFSNINNRAADIFINLPAQHLFIFFST